MPGAIKITPRMKYGAAFPASRYNDPRGGRSNSIERNILRYRAIETSLYLFYTEDVREFLLKSIYPLVFSSPTEIPKIIAESDRLQALLSPLIDAGAIIYLRKHDGNTT